MTVHLLQGVDSPSVCEGASKSGKTSDNRPEGEAPRGSTMCVCCVAFQTLSSEYFFVFVCLSLSLSLSFSLSLSLSLSLSRSLAFWFAAFSCAVRVRRTVSFSVPMSLLLLPSRSSFFARPVSRPLCKSYAFPQSTKAGQVGSCCGQ